MVGQLPAGLRVGVRTLTIHKGDHLLGGGNHDILIHQEHAEQSMQRGFLEEELMHEAAHSSLDADHAKADDWLAAQQADGNFISTYARDHPAREDIAESFSAYFVVRYRSNRVPKSTVQKIKRTIPNRIAYFDSLALDMYPTWSPPEYGEASHGLGTTLSYVVAGTTDVLAEVEYLHYAMHNGRWVLVVFNDPPVPEDDPCYGMTHEYWDLETGNWVACLRDGELLGELTPHIGFFRFPMTVGDKWTQVMSWTDHVHPEHSSNAPFGHTYAVEECGIEVTVPAAEFTTCRVRFVEASHPDIVPETRWYDPELDLVIKRDRDGVVYELWDYDLNESPLRFGSIGQNEDILAGDAATIQALTAPDGTPEATRYTSADGTVQVGILYDADGLPELIVDEIDGWQIQVKSDAGEFGALGRVRRVRQTGHISRFLARH